MLDKPLAGDRLTTMQPYMYCNACIVQFIAAHAVLFLRFWIQLIFDQLGWKEDKTIRLSFYSFVSYRKDVSPQLWVFHSISKRCTGCWMWCTVHLCVLAYDIYDVSLCAVWCCDNSRKQEQDVDLTRFTANKLTRVSVDIVGRAWCHADGICLLLRAWNTVWVLCIEPTYSVVPMYLVHLTYVIVELRVVEETYRAGMVDLVGLAYSRTDI